MRVFVTGATGYIGMAVTSALINAGHEVTALARPSSETAALERAGVIIVRGELKDLARHRQAIQGHDAVIHTAIDRSNPGESDAAALDVLLPIEGLKLLYTSSVWLFGDTGDRIVDETAELFPIGANSWRASHETRALTEAKGGAAVIRSGCVYGGSQSLLADWFAAAEAGDPLELIGDGLNRWAMVHQDDLADLYLKLLEGDQEGTFHGVDDSRATLGQMARGIIEGIDSRSEIVHKPLHRAEEELGSFAEGLALDQHVSSDWTRSRLGWEPSVSFLHSIERQWEEWTQAKSR